MKVSYKRNHPIEIPYFQFLNPNNLNEENIQTLQNTLDKKLETAYLNQTQVVYDICEDLYEKMRSICENKKKELENIEAWKENVSLWELREEENKINGFNLFINVH